MNLERENSLREMMARIAKVAEISFAKLGENSQIPPQEEFLRYVETIASQFELTFIDSHETAHALRKFYILAFSRGIIIGNQSKIKKSGKELFEQIITENITSLEKPIEDIQT